MAKEVVLLIVAVLLAGARGQCVVSAGGLTFDLSLANNGNDVTVAMGSTGYNAVMNACRSIISTDPTTCQAGTLACQKAASSGAPYKTMARAITTSSYDGTWLKVTYDNGDFCPTPNVNRRVTINYTCGTSGASVPTYVNESPSCAYNFNWVSPAGCGVSPTSSPTTPAPTSSPAPSSLAVGGQFTTAGGVTANNVARWDGTRWSAYGPGVPGINVQSFAEFNGDLVAGGALGSGDPTYRVAQWTGSTWLPLADGFNNAVYDLEVYDGLLVAGGAFSTPQAYLAAWNGSTWSAVTAGVSSNVHALMLYNGDLVAGGSFTTAGGVTVNRIARWNGATWAALGSGTDGNVYALLAYNGNVVAGGNFVTAGGVSANRIAQWNGASWSALGSGVNSIVYALTAYNGNLVAGGEFTTAGGISASNIALWNGASWLGFGSGVNGPVNVLAVSSGSLIVGGLFSTAGGVAANRIAQWNGASWSALGSGATGGVYALRAVSGEEQPPTPTPTPTTMPTPTLTPTTAPTTTPPGDCSLTAFDWRAQYYTNDTVLVEDALAFDGPSRTFEQNTTAFPFQVCLPNWVDWRGDYEQVNATSLLLSYARCTQSGFGCLSCGPTYEEWVGVSFAADCETVTLKHPNGDVRTYFPAKA